MSDLDDTPRDFKPRSLPHGWRPLRESLLPPRAWPAATSSGALIGAAAVAAASIASPLERALVMLACGVVAWGIGYFTAPPRRHFRRGDRE